MTKTLVTGATGLVGYSLMQALLKEGRDVRALVRSYEKAKQIFPANVELVLGDVTDPASVQRAMVGCETVIHAAGIPEQWLANTDLFAQVNVGGTKNMIDAALAGKIKRFVYVSTVDIFEASTGETFTELKIASTPKGTPYERSKQDADRLVVNALARGLPAVFVHPAAVYGPGPVSSAGLTQLIIELAQHKVPMVPPGVIPVVFADDLAAGILAAEKRALVGERFIFCESAPEFIELTKVIVKVLGHTKLPGVLPLWLAKTIAAGGEWFAGVSGRPPLIHQGQLHLLQWRAIPLSDHAKRRLDWNPLNLEEGLRKTAFALHQQGLVPHVPTVPTDFAAVSNRERPQNDTLNTI